MSISSVKCLTIKGATLCLLFLSVVGAPSHAIGDDSVVHEIDYVPKASSVLTQGSLAYSATNIRSMDVTTAWCEGDEGDGVGEWIDIEPTSKIDKVGRHRVWVKILPGFAKTDTLFIYNNRPSHIKVIINPTNVDGKRLEKVVQLVDRPEMQSFDISYEGAIDSIRLVMQKVLQGKKYRDTCITEVRLYIATEENSKSTKKYKSSFEEEVAQYRKEKVEVEAEERLLQDNQAKAIAGNEESIIALMRLGAGYYIRGAEGGQMLDELYLDTFVGHPERFLFLLSRQEPIVRARVMKALESPVNDKYSDKELLNQLKRARKNGVQYEYMTDLETALKR